MKIRVLIAFSMIGLCNALAACDAANGPQTTDTAAPQHRPDVTDRSALVVSAADAMPTATAGLTLGTYIDPATMSVGGNGSILDVSDHLFAAVTFPPHAAGTRIHGRVIDESGAEIMSAESVVQDVSQAQANLDFGVPTSRALKAGSYKVSVIVGDASAMTQEFVVR